MGTNYYMEDTPNQDGVVQTNTRSYLTGFSQDEINTRLFTPRRSAGYLETDRVYGNIGNYIDEDSKYLDRLTNIEDVIYGDKSLTNLYGLAQTGLEKIGSGILKGAVLAGTTFIDGLVGLPVGLINMMSGGEDGKSLLSDFWNNPVSRALQSVNEWSEKVLPNYYTKEEEERPWYKNVFTANFLGDKLIKNLGFMVGAAAAGKVNAGMLSKAMGMNKARSAFKGALTEAGINDLTQSQILKNVSSGKYTFNQGALLDDLAKQAKTLSMKSNTLQLAGSLTAGMGEARIQAILNTNDARERYTAEIDAEMENIIAEERSKLSPEHTTLTKDEEGNIQVGLTPEGLAELDNKVRFRKESALAEMEKRLAKMGNVDFAVNTAILSTSDWILFGKFFAGGYKNANRARNIARNAAGEFVRPKQVAKNIAKLAKNPIAEGTGEMMQEVSGAASLMMYEPQSWIEASLNPEANKNVRGFVSSFAKALVDTYSDVDKWENFAIGAIIGMGGAPTLAMSTNKLGKKRPVGVEGGIWGDLREIRELKQADEKLISELNEIVLSEEKDNYMRNLIINDAFEIGKERDLENGDEFSYKNKETAQLVSNIITFDLAGRLLDLKDMAESFGNITEENVPDIIAQTVNKESGKSIYDGMTPDKVVLSVKNQAKQLSDMMDSYAKISDDLQTVAGKDLNTEELQELTWMAMRIDDWEARFKYLWSDVQESFQGMSPEFRNLMIEVDGKLVPLSETINMSPALFLISSVKPITETFLESAVNTKLSELELKDKQSKSPKAKDPKNQKILNKVDKKGKLLSIPKQLLELLKKAVEKNQLISLDTKKLMGLINDLSQILSSRADFMIKYHKYLNEPEVLKEDIKKVKEEGLKKQEELARKEESAKNKTIKDKLLNVQTLEDFKRGLMEVDDPSKSLVENIDARDRLADEMSKSDHPVAMAYMNIVNTHKALVKILNDDFSTLMNREGAKEFTEELIADARFVLDRLAQNAQDGNDLRVENSQVLDAINIAFDPDTGLNEGGLTFERLDNAKALVSRLIKSMNYSVKTHPSNNVVVPTQAALMKVEDIPSKKGEDVVLVGSTDDALMFAAISQGSETLGLSKDTFIPTAPEGKNQVKQHKYWKPAISEDVIDDFEKGEVNKIHGNKDKRFEGMQPIMEVLSEKNPETGESAFSYVNKGNLQPGAEISFRIDPNVTNKQGMSGTPILMYHGDQLVGVLPEGNAKAHERLAETREEIIKSYNEFVSKPENKGKVYTSSIKTEVGGLLPGRFVYSKTGEKDVSSLFDTEFDDVVFGFVKQGLYNLPNLEDDRNYPEVANTKGKEGMLFMHVKAADGKYYPIAVRTKHFNEKEFNLDDPKVQQTSKFKNIKNAVDKIYEGLDGDNPSLKLEGLKELSQEVYLPGTLYADIVNSTDLATPDKKFIRLSSKDEAGKEMFSIILPYSDKSGALPDTMSFTTDEISAPAAKVSKDNFTKNMMEFIQRIVNPKFQISGKKLNSGTNNKDIIDSNILTTNLVLKEVASAWFQVKPVKPDGTMYSLEEMGLGKNKSEFKKKTTATPVGGKETVDDTVSITIGDNTYKVDKEGELIGDVPLAYREKVKDLAFIKMNRGTDKVVEFEEHWVLLKSPGEKIYINLKTLEYAGIPEAIAMENRRLGLKPTELKGSKNYAEVLKNLYELGLKNAEKDVEEKAVITYSYGGYRGPIDEANKDKVVKVDKSGTDGDVRPNIDRVDKEAVDKFNKLKEPFTYIVTIKGKKYLVATAGLNNTSRFGEGGRTGNVFVSMELTDYLTPKHEEYLMRMAIKANNEANWHGYKTGGDPKDNVTHEYSDKYIGVIKPKTFDKASTPQETPNDFRGMGEEDLSGVKPIASFGAEGLITGDKKLDVLEKPVSKPAMTPNKAMAAALGAGLVVNPNFKPTQSAKTEALKTYKIGDELIGDLIEFNNMMKAFPEFMKAKGFTESSWNKLTNEEKDHERKCAGVPY